MADEKIDRIRLAFMQDVLPVGLAMFERVRQGGVKRVLEVINESKAPLDDLKKEGESAAKDLREKLDSVSPGLGNPVMSVNVGVEDSIATSNGIADEEELVKLLSRIESRLEELENHLADNTFESSINS
ncbi:hypothetical protein [Prochlorococcus sp. MIT 1341]|uniref:hypothetical protein n=1 Tax=Prochlorococcus sp. MIT 1341 TaxID=3096221 RepID=UPI002A75DABD|nr:hypothetical protein [Prochlorococcus sp. MIT 1341]